MYMLSCTMSGSICWSLGTCHILSSAYARLRVQKTSGWLLPVRSLRYAWICLFKDDMGEMTGCLRISPFRSFLDVSCVARRVTVGFTRRKTSGSAVSGPVAGAAMPVFLAPAKRRSRCHLALCTICMEARTPAAPVIGILFLRQDMPTSSWQRTQTQAAQSRTAYSVGRTHNTRNHVKRQAASPRKRNSNESQCSASECGVLNNCRPLWKQPIVYNLAGQVVERSSSEKNISASQSSAATQTPYFIESLFSLLSLACCLFNGTLLSTSSADCTLPSHGGCAAV